MLKLYNDKNELERLRQLYGAPSINKVVIEVDDSFPPPWSNDRVGEVVMVLQNTTQKIWVMRKDHYPSEVYRLPSGGIEKHENVNSALKRELKEETGLEIAPKRFLEVVYYEFVTKSGKKAFFTSYIFHFQPVDETSLNPDIKRERISNSLWIEISKLKTLGKLIKEHTDYKKPLVYGNRADWCKFRSIIHSEVYKLLS